tara:strand:- start:414 stop:911 length:498 start_codon:yes stop_codon:yes gene_type:complete
MEACAKLLGVPFCADKSSVRADKNPFRYAGTIALVAGGIVIVCVIAAVAFASATGREVKSLVVAPAVVAVVVASLVAAGALVHYVPALSTALWCGEAQLCDCLVRNSGMEAPHAAALAQTARTYKNMLRRRHKGGFHTLELLTTGSDLAEQLKQAHPVCLREYGI